MPFFNKFTKGDPYDRSVEEFVSKAAIGDQFIISKTGPGWTVSKLPVPVALSPQELSSTKPPKSTTTTAVYEPPVEKPGNKEKKDVPKRIKSVRKTGREAPSRRGGISER